MPGLSCREAIRRWEQKTGISPSEAKEVSLICQLPSPIDRLDDSINQFEQVTKLSLSTNSIDRIVPMPRLKYLTILSLARNNLKNLRNLDDVASTLEQLWVSYNQIDRLEGIAPLQKLHTLYIANNKIRSWDEVGKCAQLADSR